MRPALMSGVALGLLIAATSAGAQGVAPERVAELKRAAADGVQSRAKLAQGHCQLV